MSKTLKTATKNKGGRPSGSTDLTRVHGVITEIIATIRKVKAGKMPHAEGRSLIWMYGQLRDTLALGMIEARLAELEGAYSLNDGARLDQPRQLHS